jgi:hypothetical protein
MESKENKMEIIRNKEARWLGHVLRIEEERWPKQRY